MTSGKKNLIYITVVALSLTNVAVAGGEETFRLMLFWPVLFVAIIVNISPSRNHPFPPYSFIFYAAVLAMSMSFVMNYNNSEVSTMIFSMAWISYWSWLIFMRWKIDPLIVRRTLEWVILIYFVLILISVVFVLFEVGESPVPEVFGWTEGPGFPRFYGATTEPSYAALILGACWLGIRRIPVAEDRNIKVRERYVLVAFVVSLLALQSVYGLLVAMLAASTKLTGYTERAQRICLIGLTLIATPFLLAMIPQNTRIGAIVSQIPSMDINKLQIIDNSAFMRIGPFYEVVSSASFFDIEFWMGHGAGISEFYFANIFGYLAGTTLYLNLGFLPAFIHDFGTISSAIIFIYLMKISTGPLSYQSRSLVILTLFNCNFNTQLFWFVATCMFLSAPIVGAQVRRVAQQFPRYPVPPASTLAPR